MGTYKLIAGMVLSLMFRSCADGSEYVETHIPPTPETKDVMIENEQDNLTMEKERLQNLLSQFSGTLESESVALDLTNLGAIHAEGYKVKDQQVFAIAYLFSNQGEHSEAYNLITNEHSDGKYHTLISSNGAWLLWTYSTVDTDETRYLIYDLASAFSGEE